MSTKAARDSIFDHLRLAEVAAPSTPAAGSAILYVKSDGLVYWKDDAGTERAVGTVAELTAHTGDASDAHDASAISIVDTGAYFTGTDVEAALQELGAAGGGGVAELDDVGDVNAPTPANGDVLTWDSTPGEWVAAAPSGGGGATIDYGSLKPATPDYDFDTGAMTGWSAHSAAGSFAIGQCFDRAIDGSQLRIAYKTGQRGLIYRTVGNTDFDIIVGGLHMPTAAQMDTMPGFAILNSSGTGVGIVQYNDNHVYLANITTYGYASILQDLGTGYGHDTTTLGIGKHVPMYYRMTRVGNTWAAYLSITGTAWDVGPTAGSSVTITADRFALGNFINNRAGLILCDFVDGI